MIGDKSQGRTTRDAVAAAPESSGRSRALDIDEPLIFEQGAVGRSG